MHRPAALFICSAFMPSEARICACLRPSATLMAASLVPSDSSTVALFLRSASTSTGTLEWWWILQMLLTKNVDKIQVSYLHLHRFFNTRWNLYVFNFVAKAADSPIIWRLVDGVDNVGIERLPFLEVKDSRVKVLLITVFKCLAHTVERSVSLPWILCPAWVCPVQNASWSVPAVWQHILDPPHHN